MMQEDNIYMGRALQLAALGRGFVSPNPQVGAVIVSSDGRIIGEGWHRRYGGPHAEVNAVNSVREEDRELLPSSTIYVTLEPCSHWGKTPPCAELLIRCRFRRVVVGIRDPFPAVAGRGIGMLRAAGIEVTEGILENECREINRHFLTPHTLGRPFIQLKWAQSADGIMGTLPSQPPLLISNPLSLGEMHAERALFDAILVGTDTIIHDNPELTVRHRPGHSPRPVIFKSGRIPTDAKIWSRNPIVLDPTLPLEGNMRILLSEHKVTSLMVEGGARTLQHFIDANLYDEIRRETSSVPSSSEGIQAPTIPNSLTIASSHTLRHNTITKLER